ncbi:hypothetical protein EK21DRAFT_96093 [Setomelanomma holmii]|uniref:Amidohydrolase-related domain-containing protein n=1 Tax=Setomelanomma holmii TaxID=210430 RepID=A0A9P4HKA2_9PLEO|nr:hypothetical protein EK21DRAFT_96093 [Setomelanomma holmii]
MAAIDRTLFLGNATQHRWSNATVAVPRMLGKIALEEHVGTTVWAKHGITPPANEIAGLGAQPFTGPNGEDTLFRLFDIPSRLASMDNAGISYVIVSIGAPGIQGISDTANATKFATEINDELYNTYVKSYPSRFGFFATVPMQDPPAAAAELECAVTTLGAKGAMINGYTEVLNPDTGSVEIQYLDEARHEPFWAKVASLNVPIYLHPRAPPVSQQQIYNYANDSRSKYPRPLAVHTLRLMITSKNTHPLRYYLRTNILATLSGVRRLSTLRCTLDEMGEDKVMWSLDYPFQSDQDAADWFDGVEGVSVEAKKKIGWGNARRVLGIGEVGDGGWVDGEDFL